MISEVITTSFGENGESTIFQGRDMKMERLAGEFIFNSLFASSPFVILNILGDPVTRV